MMGNKPIHRFRSDGWIHGSSITPFALVHRSSLFRASMVHLGIPYPVPPQQCSWHRGGTGGSRASLLLDLAFRDFRQTIWGTLSQTFVCTEATLIGVRELLRVLRQWSRAGR
jgi:hypothetical protein